MGSFEWTPGQRRLAGWTPGGAPGGPGEGRDLKQHFTGARLARMIASMMDYSCDEVRLLDPGAGGGALFTACVERACSLKRPPGAVSVTACEVDHKLHGELESALGAAGDACRRRGVRFSSRLSAADFLLDPTDCAVPGGHTHVVANPPYGKLAASTATHRSLRRAGIHTTNTYTAFLELSQGLLRDGGQMAFISPRSFCNGSYFDRFRAGFLDAMSLRRVHLFGSRTEPFGGVLQETVIMCAQKGGRRGTVGVSTSAGPVEDACAQSVPYGMVVRAGDPRRVIHVAADSSVAGAVTSTGVPLGDLGLSVSTGRVVGFRARDWLRRGPGEGCVPLVRPFHITGGVAVFPASNRKKHDHIMDNRMTRGLLVEDGTYVLVKRMSSGEERRRVVAAVWEGGGRVGFENMVNYFHADGGGLDADVAKGLCAYLNSGMVDAYFREFSGNTHVNAADLRYLRYPPLDALRRLGIMAPDGPPNSEALDALLAGML